MKKILSLLVLLITFASCEEDIKFNNPAVQGLKDDVLWRASEFSAVKSGNSVIVTATNGFETVVLRMANPAPESVHVLGENETDKASYSLDTEGIIDFYQTGTDLGNGEIEIRPAVDNNIAATDGKGFISGSFFFNAVNDAGDVVNYQKGVFYRVPIESVQ